MEFTNRSDNRTNAPMPAPPAGGGPIHKLTRRKPEGWGPRTIRIELFIVIVGSALLLAAVALYLALSGPAATEAKQIDDSKYQAVFLNGGATSGSVAYTTYFGKLTTLNDKYFILKDVYYLTTDQTTNANQSITPQLTKLGCQQLHSPYDEMVINRSQVAFWENLQDSGQVVTKIKEYKQQNPNGPNCSQTQSSTTTQNPATTPTNTQNSTKKP